MKRSDIRELVLETLLEFERAKGNAPKPKKAGKKKAKAKAKTPIEIPAFLPKISDEALLRAAGGRLTKPKVNPFKFAVPPPGVLPEGVPAMAQDSAMGSALGWAGSFGGQVFAEGLEFLGYPYLAELAQRPEYRVITETIATEMTRKWIKLQVVGDEDKTAQIKAIEDEFTRLGVRDAIPEGVGGRRLLRPRAHLSRPRNDRRPRGIASAIGNGQNAMSKAKVGRGLARRAARHRAGLDLSVELQRDGPAQAGLV